MNAGLSQKELAALIGTTQSVISRLEDSDYGGRSLTMLERIWRRFMGDLVDGRFEAFGPPELVHFDDAARVVEERLADADYVLVALDRGVDGTPT